jgi:cation transport ATPase
MPDNEIKMGMKFEGASALVSAQPHHSPTHSASSSSASDSEVEGTEHEHGFDWLEASRILFVAAAAGAVWFLGPNLSLAFLIAGVICTLAGGYPIFHEALENILERRMTMELSMAIAILAALAIREVFTALVITLFVLVAEVLEGLTVGRGRRAIRHLVEFLPTTATVNDRGGWREIGIQQLVTGDVVLIKPGSRIPVDGPVVGGHSFVDQAAITGESMPVEKKPGTSVYAGTINQSGALEVRVESLGRDTTFGKIIQAVEQAEKSRAPIQRIADRLAGYLVYFALGAAVLTFLLTHNIRSTISVVIVARRGQFLGTLVIADLLRPEAKEAIRALKSMRLRTVLLTGDAKAVAEDIGKQLGVDEVASELLPEEKLQYVVRLTEGSHTVAMVGDGVNDAPALVQAQVGIAMGSGTDVARESADVVLIGSDLSKLVETLRIARRCRRTILQNFVGTLAVDSVGVGMAAFGLLNPLVAAFIHVSSEMVFILNSARLVPSASLKSPFSRQGSFESRLAVSGD